MPRLSYTELIKVYTYTPVDDAWHLIKQHANIRIAPISDTAAMNEGARFNAAANVTHRGRCAYDSDLASSGADRRLLVRISDGQQFEVLRWREGSRRVQAGQRDMYLSLVWIEPMLHNLYDT